MAEIRLTTGGIGTGKSYKNVKDAYEELQKGDKSQFKRIYSNIRAHAELCPGILPLPDDWRECEPDSLIIIDECQKHEKFSKHFSTRRDSEIVDLTMIRHNRCSMWLISPNATLVNKDVRDLVNCHIFLEANGSKTTKAYCFDKVVINLNKSAKTKAYDEFTYEIEPKYCQMYKSTEDGVPSGRTYHPNIKLISFIVGMIFIIAIICALVAWLLKATGSKINEVQAAETKNNSVQVDPVKNAFGSPAAQQQLSQDECRKGINVDKPECIEYFNDLSKNNKSVNPQGIQTVSYDPSSPYDLEGVQASVSYQINNKPVFSGCMKTGNTYTAYTQQGTKLNVSANDCRNLIENNDRPFDYFSDRKLAAQTTQPTLQQQKNTDESVYYRKALIDNLARIEAEKMARSHNAQVVEEDLPFDYKPSKFMESSNAL